jgi:predicted metalloendopeptidase
MLKKFLAGLSLALPLAVSTAVHGADVSQPATLISGIQQADMKPSVRAQDDLFTNANGTWLDKTPIPEDKAWYGESAVMADRAQVQLHEILEAAATSSNKEERKAGDLYTSFMDTATVQLRGLAPLKHDFDRVAAVENTTGLGDLMGYLNHIGVMTPIGPDIEPDHRQSSRYAYYIGQSGLGMPDRDYYLSRDAKLIHFKVAYRQHIEAMLRLLGDANAGAEADHIMAIENGLAKIEWTNVQNRDSIKVYNAKTEEQLVALAPALDWAAYFKAANVTGVPVLVVQQPSYLSGLSRMLQAIPVANWKEYFRYRILSARAAYLPQPFVEEDFNFKEHILSGTPQQRERWKRGVELVDSLMGEESGKLYVAKYFPPETKARVEQMVHNLISTYRTSIDQLAWMSTSSKPEAKAKLDTLNVKIGYPSKWRDYSALQITADDLYGNVTRALQFEQDRKLALLPGPVDHTEWDMTASTVNAYYSPELNEIVFPAAILQPPAYDANADDAYNYGSTGATIGHELSHAFDDDGSQYDSKGNLRDWMTKADHAQFKILTARLVKEFSAFEPVKGFHINGALTLGENIADIAGIEIAYKAYLATLDGKPAPVIDGMTGDQRFYLGYAQSWLGKERESALIAQLKSDPHSPEKYRVNGVVVHLPSFYQAFSVTSSDKMWMAPEQRVTLW